MLDPVFDALQSGADRIIEALGFLAIAYVPYLVARVSPTLLKGVPAFLRAFVASAIEAQLMPLVVNGVRYAQKVGSDLAAKGIAKAKAEINEAQLAAAKKYVLDRIPNWWSQTRSSVR